MIVSVAELAKLAKAVYDPAAAVPNWTPARIFGNHHRGFFGTLYLSQDGEDAVLAFRGTDDLLNDGLNDVGLFLGLMIPQVAEARRAFGQARDSLGSSRDLYITGHSLGGGLASIVGLESGEETVTFNSPGMARSFINGHFSFLEGVIRLYQLNRSRLLHVRSKFDIVSVGTGPTLGRVRTVSVPGCPITNPQFNNGKFDPLRTARDTGRFLLGAPGYVLCQHDMGLMRDFLAGAAQFNTDLALAESWDDLLSD